MCGGRGTRLAADREKPLVPIAGTPMVERVRGALAASSVERVFAVTSPATPETAATLHDPIIETPGDGYVADLERALDDDRVTTPVLTVAADLPLLDGDAVDDVLAANGADRSLSVVVPVGRKRALGLSVDTRFRHRGVAVTPAGVNVVGDDGDRFLRQRDPQFAFNVNRWDDCRAADWWLAGRM
jgi:adenosylcobinamide-phosphate guanylyltransferase